MIPIYTYTGLLANLCTLVCQQREASWSNYKYRPLRQPLRMAWNDILHSLYSVPVDMYGLEAVSLTHTSNKMRTDSTLPP